MASNEKFLPSFLQTDKAPLDPEGYKIVHNPRFFRIDSPWLTTIDRIHKIVLSYFHSFSINPTNIASIVTKYLGFDTCTIQPKGNIMMMNNIKKAGADHHYQMIVVDMKISVDNHHDLLENFLLSIQLTSNECKHHKYKNNGYWLQCGLIGISKKIVDVKDTFKKFCKIIKTIDYSMINKGIASNKNRRNRNGNGNGNVDSIVGDDRMLNLSNICEIKEFKNKIKGFDGWNGIETVYLTNFHVDTRPLVGSSNFNDKRGRRICFFGSNNFYGKFGATSDETTLELGDTLGMRISYVENKNKNKNEKGKDKNENDKKIEKKDDEDNENDGSDGVSVKLRFVKNGDKSICKTITYHPEYDPSYEFEKDNCTIKLSNDYVYFPVFVMLCCDCTKDGGTKYKVQFETKL